MKWFFPFCKQNDKDDEPMEDVYAGPDFYEKEPDPTEPDEAEEEKKNDDPPMEKVYAGPSRPKKSKVFRKEPIKCVYAGPEYFRKKDPPVEGVYAGPDFYKDGSNEPDEPDFSDEAPMPPFEPPLATVYAGPEQMSGTYEPKGVYVSPDEIASKPPMMMVYAGPEQMSGAYSPIGAYSPVDSDGKFCPCCGSRIEQEDAKFCAECGAELP